MTKTGRIEWTDFGWRLYVAILAAFVAAFIACLIKASDTPAPLVAGLATAGAAYIVFRRFEAQSRLVRHIRGVTAQGANVVVSDDLLSRLPLSPSELVAAAERVIDESRAYWMGKYGVLPGSWRGMIVEYVDAPHLRHGNASFGGGKAHGLVVGKFVGIAWAPDDNLAHVEAKLRHEADHVHLMAAGVPTDSHHAMMERHGRG